MCSTAQHRGRPVSGAPGQRLPAQPRGTRRDGRVGQRRSRRPRGPIRRAPGVAPQPARTRWLLRHRSPSRRRDRRGVAGVRPSLTGTGSEQTFGSGQRRPSVGAHGCNADGRQRVTRRVGRRDSHTDRTGGIARGVPGDRAGRRRRPEPALRQHEAQEGGGGRIGLASRRSPGHGDAGRGRVGRSRTGRSTTPSTEFSCNCRCPTVSIRSRSST